MFTAFNLFSALSFLGYGISCVATVHMVQEFERYGLAGYRKLTGVLQIFGATGLLIGFWVPWIGVLASGGLALQMLLGFGVRLKIKDPFHLCLPSFSFLLLNAWLCAQFLNR